MGEYAIPDQRQLDNIKRQAEALKKVYDAIGGFNITSWLRTPSYNKLIGGAKKSAHLTGLATDFVPNHMDVEQAKKIIQDQGIYSGGGEINSTTWIHLDLVHKRWFMA